MTKLQIEQFLGKRSQIGEDTVRIAIKVSDGHEKHFRKRVMGPKKRVKLVQLVKPPRVATRAIRLNIEDATRELADFTHTQVQ